MLRGNEWMDCMPGNCLLHRKNKHPCPMPMQQICCDTMITSHIQRHNVPVFQVEVAREKGTQKQDDRKICLTSSWNLCYTSRAYGMEVGKDSATIIKMEKNRKSTVIECSKFQVDLNGSGISGKIFKQLLKVLGLIKVDLHASCRRNQKCMVHAPPYLGLAKLNQITKSDKRKNESIGESCFFIPSMEMIFDKKKNFTVQNSIHCGVLCCAKF